MGVEQYSRCRLLHRKPRCSRINPHEGPWAIRGLGIFLHDIGEISKLADASRNGRAGFFTSVHRGWIRSRVCFFTYHCGRYEGTSHRYCGTGQQGGRFCRAGPSEVDRFDRRRWRLHGQGGSNHSACGIAGRAAGPWTRAGEPGSEDTLGLRNHAGFCGDRAARHQLRRSQSIPSAFRSGKRALFAKHWRVPGSGCSITGFPKISSLGTGLASDMCRPPAIARWDGRMATWVAGSGVVKRRGVCAAGRPAGVAV